MGAIRLFLRSIVFPAEEDAVVCAGRHKAVAAPKKATATVRDITVKRRCDLALEYIFLTPE
jgi:hypothetical protein